MITSLRKKTQLSVFKFLIAYLALNILTKNRIVSMEYPDAYMHMYKYMYVCMYI